MDMMGEKKKRKEHAWQGINVKNEEFKFTSEECDPIPPISWFTGEFTVLHFIYFILFYSGNKIRKQINGV